MYVVSPWSKGGWVNSEVFDHTSVGRFIEARFGVTIPAISPWHRAVCGDLVSCFDFAGSDSAVPQLPDVSGSTNIIAEHQRRPRILPPRAAEDLFQEPGIRRSRALSYRLAVDAQVDAASGRVELSFRNEGAIGAVFHVYDRLHLERIPRRYTVEAGKDMSDNWVLAKDATRAFDLWVLGPNGFVRHFQGSGAAAGAALVAIRQKGGLRGLDITFDNRGNDNAEARLGQDAYGKVADRKLAVAARTKSRAPWSTADSHDWYDFTITQNGIAIRAAGRIERGGHGISDPLMAVDRSVVS